MYDLNKMRMNLLSVQIVKTIWQHILLQGSEAVSAVISHVSNCDFSQRCSNKNEYLAFLEAVQGKVAKLNIYYIIL